MKEIRLQFESAFENVAFEELMLEMAETESGGEVVRFWEPGNYFVVLGRSCVYEEEVYVDRCLEDQIPVIRRASGGGTILAGPGCLMYSNILSLSGRPEVADISLAHRFHAELFRKAYGECGVSIEQQGHSDLCFQGKKFSGNALRVARNHLLYHGTLMFDLSIELIEKYLRLPKRRPEYRKDRSHYDFLVNVPVSLDDLQASIRNQLGAKPGSFKFSRERLNELVSQRYENPKWNTRH